MTAVARSSRSGRWRILTPHHWRPRRAPIAALLLLSLLASGATAVIFHLANTTLGDELFAHSPYASKRADSSGGAFDLKSAPSGPDADAQPGAGPDFSNTPSLEGRETNPGTSQGNAAPSVGSPQTPNYPEPLPSTPTDPEPPTAPPTAPPSVDPTPTPTPPRPTESAPVPSPSECGDIPSVYCDMEASLGGAG